MGSSYTKQTGREPALAACTCGFVHIPCGKKFIAFIQEILLVPTSSFSLRLKFGCIKTVPPLGVPGSYI